MTVLASEVAHYLDEFLRTASVPDYPTALNGLQFDHHGPVRRVGAAVDFSLRALDQAVERDVNLLLVHHGMFWGGVQRAVGPDYLRLRRLLDHDIAVYASHLPLDGHPAIGNGTLLARELGLVPLLPFAHYQGVAVGVAGETDVETADLVARAERFARTWGGAARASAMEPNRRSRRWAVCTGAGASADTLREAGEMKIDTLIVGEGPHHTAVDAPEHGVVIIYAGHYATETLGVRALADHLSQRFSVPWEFILAPTGL